MAVLAAQSVLPTLGGIVNPYLTAEHDAFAWVEIPYASAAQAWPGGASVVSDWPVQANGREIEVQQTGAWLYDYYYRIHISPQRLDLGNVVSAQTQEVFLWNAFLEPRTLVDIGGTDEGVLVSGQPDPPLLFPALKELTWQLTVTPDGQPVLDTVVTWEFDNGRVAGLRITANRIIAWTFVPDWGDSIRERLTGATDILQSESGVSQRRWSCCGVSARSIYNPCSTRRRLPSRLRVPPCQAWAL